jgi:hypothetical protein
MNRETAASKGNGSASESSGLGRLPTLERLEWQHRQKEIALGKKLPPSEELARLRLMKGQNDVQA